MKDFNEVFQKMLSAKECLGGLSNTPLDTHFDIKKSVCIDYFKVRFNRVFSLSSKEFKTLLTLLGVESEYVTEEEGLHRDGYESCFTLGSDIQFMYGGLFTSSNGKETCCLQLKGSACRSFDDRMSRKNIPLNKAWYDLVDFCISHDCVVNRIDTPLDYFGDDVTFTKMLDKIYKKFFTTIFKSNPVIEQSNGISITFGKFSNRTLCIYDKRKEREFKDYDCFVNNWIRFEARFKTGVGDDFIKKLLVALYNDDLGTLVTGVLKDFLDFKEKNNYDEAHQCLADTVSWWDDLLDNSQKIKIHLLPRNKTSLLKKYLWLDRSTSKARLLVEIAYPDLKDELFSLSAKNHMAKIFPKDVALINEDLIRTGRKEINCFEAKRRLKHLYGNFKASSEVMFVAGVIDENGNVFNKKEEL